jgi:hypothetical protein
MIMKDMLGDSPTWVLVRRVGLESTTWRIVSLLCRHLSMSIRVCREQLEQQAQTVTADRRQRSFVIVL